MLLVSDSKISMVKQTFRYQNDATSQTALRSFLTFFEHTMIKAIPSGFGFPAPSGKMRLQAMDNLRPFTPKRSHNSMSLHIDDKNHLPDRWSPLKVIPSNSAFATSP